MPMPYSSHSANLCELCKLRILEIADKEKVSRSQAILILLEEVE